MSTLHSGLWERMRKGLERVAEEKHSQDIDTVRLVISIIISAGQERDQAYLGTDQFLYHCFLSGLNSDYVIALLERAWYHIDNKIPIQPPQEEEYELDDADFN